MEINGYTVVNEDKFQRAVFGVIGREGKATGGVGENASDEEKLAEYDRLGGLVMKGKVKVKTGSFYDFDKKSPRENPEVILVFRDLEGKAVELSEDEDLPVEVRAAEAIKEKKSRGGKKGKAVVKEEETEEVEEE